MAKRISLQRFPWTKLRTADASGIADHSDGIADEKVRPQTIAPKFTGRFNKGVDYVGDLVQFEKEFNDDLVVIAHAVKTYGLPVNLKLCSAGS
ncbi:MAG: tagaturonate epimerase family protein [Planctomycetaceae bacterium]